MNRPSSDLRACEQHQHDRDHQHQHDHDHHVLVIFTEAQTIEELAIVIQVCERMITDVREVLGEDVYYHQMVEDNNIIYYL